MILSFLYKYSMYLFNVTHTHNNTNVYFYRQPISALVMSHYQALSKNKNLKLHFGLDILHYRGIRLRHCATSRTVAGLIPDDVIGIFL